uniref:uncharacterized protein LOC120334440 n=1 Tax=Styela clava TaxID=7725 RepID=UPI00193AB301|nr:uncharacterized protein LOC120334440 [Styela clava]
MGYTKLYLLGTLLICMNGYTGGSNHPWLNTWNSNPFQRFHLPTAATPRRSGRTRSEKVSECPSGTRHDAKPECKKRESGEAVGCPKITCKFYPTYGEVVDRGADKKNIFGKWRKILKEKDGSYKKFFTAKMCRYPNKICDCDKGSCNKCSDSKVKVCAQKWTIKHASFYIEDLSENYNKSKPFKVSPRQLTPEEEIEAISRHFGGASDFRTSTEIPKKPIRLPTPTSRSPNPPRPPMPPLTTRPNSVLSPTKSTLPTSPLSSTQETKETNPPRPTRTPFINRASRPPMTVQPILVWSRTPRLSFHEQMQILMWQRFLFAMTFHGHLSSTSTRRPRQRSQSKREKSKSKPRSSDEKRKVRLAVRIPSGCSCKIVD